MHDLTIPRADHTPIDNYFLDFVIADLTMAEVKVYCALTYERHWGGSDVVSVSYQALARQTGLSKVAVMRGIWMLYARRMIDKELVTNERGCPEGNRYRLLPLPECPEGPDPRANVQP